MEQAFSQNKPAIKNEKSKRSFGIYIKKHRKAKNMTQQDLADALGVSKKSVCAFEKGHTFPNQENIFKLAKILDLSLDEFVFGESICEHDICIKEINEMLRSLSDIEKGMAIKMLKSTIETIITGRKS